MNVIMKSRMRERRTYGSVRGLWREPLVYSTCEKRIVSNPKGINRKKLVPFVLLINAQRGCKEKLNMTDKVKYES